MAIVSFKSRWLKDFFLTGLSKKLDQKTSSHVMKELDRVDYAQSECDLKYPTSNRKANFEDKGKYRNFEITLSLVKIAIKGEWWDNNAKEVDVCGIYDDDEAKKKTDDSG